MFNFLENLRQKPVSVRKRVAFLTALSIAGLIFVVWLSVIYPDFYTDQTQQAKAKVVEPSPVSTFGDTMRSGLAKIGAQFGELKNTLSSFTTMTATTTYYSSTTTDSTSISTTTGE